MLFQPQVITKKGRQSLILEEALFSLSCPGAGQVFVTKAGRKKSELSPKASESLAGYTSLSDERKGKEEEYNLISEELFSDYLFYPHTIFNHDGLQPTPRTASNYFTALLERALTPPLSS